tara:strand:- start:1353 stop:1481 length:129 start_codon:yes stop_codon:yes gene_type:complete
MVGVVAVLVALLFLLSFGAKVFLPLHKKASGTGSAGGSLFCG